MEIVIIAAVSKNDVIGFRGKMPWDIPEDRKRFREMTMGNAVVMGRLTYESIDEKYRPLKGRLNIVLSRNSEYRPEGVVVCRSLDDALRVAERNRVDKVYIAGGKEVYQKAMEIANRIELTKVHKGMEGDVFFPRFNISDWSLISESEIFDSGSGLRYSSFSWRRDE